MDERTSLGIGGNLPTQTGAVPVDDLRVELLRRRNGLLRHVARAEEDLHWLDTNVEIDVEDEGQEAAMAGLLAGLDTHDRNEIDAIERALGRIATGDYGRCLMCGRLIPAARLEALPEAETCIACAAANELSAAAHPYARSGGRG